MSNSGANFFSNPDRPWRPKPWTSNIPPRAFSRSLLDIPTLLGLALVTAGCVLVILAPTHIWWGGTAINAGMLVLIGYSVREVRRWWRELRWSRSAPPPNTLDDQ